MRLRLSIYRNELPAVTVIWPVAATNLKQTVAQLLEHVNGTFPLEGEAWGLEDYSVTVGGFECLHYHEIGTAFKDEDEVSIRPLQFADVKARRLTGRVQISGDGRHLVDGVPFGKPQLKLPTRPEIRIPPRKRRRLNFDSTREPIVERLDQADGGEDEDEDEDDDDDDEDFTGDDDDGDAESGDEDAEVEEAIEKEDDGLDDSDEQESSSGSDFDDGGQRSAASSSGTSEESWDGVQSSPTPEQKATAARRSSNTHLNGTELTSAAPRELHSQKLKRKLGPGTTDVADQSESVSKIRYVGTPYEGMTQTQQRNARRRESKKLKHLKILGLLDENASIAAMHQWEQNHKPTNPGHMHLKDAMQTLADTGVNVELKFEEKQQRLLRDIASGGIDITLHAQRPNGIVPDVDNGRVRDKLPLKKAIVQPEADENMPPLEDRDDARASKVKAVKVSDMVPPSVARRSRLDLASSKRLLLGSLGLRVPKTPQEKEALQKKLAAKTTRAPVAFVKNATEPFSAVTTLKNGVAEGEEGQFWRSNIDLRAVECCDEGVELEVPPFPFFQCWDPQYKRAKNKKRKKEIGSNHFHGQYVETYDKYNQNGAGDALEYDEAEADDEYWEEGALVDSAEEGAKEADEDHLIPDDGFPNVPEDPTILPVLPETDAKKDDFIVFTELACSAATEWQPRMLVRTAQLQSKDTGGWTIKLALRDMPRREYDEEGKRVYRKFEMQGIDDDEDEEDARVRLVKWDELGAPRLLKRNGQTVERASP